MEGQVELKKDLMTLEPEEFYFKHIVKSRNWYFSEYLHIPPEEIDDKMDYFKEIVSIKLGISFHSLQIVGSAKVGYSLSPNKLFKPFHDEEPNTPSSDIDIAIVSERLYQHFWDEARKSKKLKYNTRYYDRITKSIYRGYINEKDLLKIEGAGKEWENLCRPINVELQDKLGFIHPVTYRIYRNWDDLQEYQIIGISNARRVLEEK